MQHDLPVALVEHVAMDEQLRAVVRDVGAVEEIALAVAPRRHEVVVLAEVHDPVAQPLEAAVEDRAADGGVVRREGSPDGLQPVVGRRTVLLEDRHDRARGALHADAAHLRNRGPMIVRGGDDGDAGILATDALPCRVAHPVDDDHLGAGALGLLRERGEAAKEKVAPGAGGDHDGHACFSFIHARKITGPRGSRKWEISF